MDSPRTANSLRPTAVCHPEGQEPGNEDEEKQRQQRDRDELKPSLAMLSCPQHHGKCLSPARSLSQHRAGGIESICQVPSVQGEGLAEPSLLLRPAEAPTLMTKSSRDHECWSWLNGPRGSLVINSDCSSRAITGY